MIVDVRSDPGSVPTIICLCAVQEVIQFFPFVHYGLAVNIQ